MDEFSLFEYLKILPEEMSFTVNFDVTMNSDDHSWRMRNFIIKMLK